MNVSGTGGAELLTPDDGPGRSCAVPARACVYLARGSSGRPRHYRRRRRPDISSQGVGAERRSRESGPGQAPSETADPSVERNRPTGLRLRLKQAPNAAKRTVNHPSWLPETVRMAIRRRRDAGRQFSLSAYPELFVTESDAVAAVTGVPCDEAASALRQGAMRTRVDESEYWPTVGGRGELLRMTTAILQLMVPAVVVETGVAQGVTTRTILEQLEANGTGLLHSVDLPVLHADEGEYVGRLVPHELRRRWNLELGPSRKVLPALVGRVAPIDVFLHDAEHSYRSQLEEYETVWPFLRPGGVLISDDVANPAFIEFARRAGARPYLVGDPRGSSAVGLISQQPRDGRRG
jgi:predicted O-methyltransferase YrrM